ncbi:MAG TPA: hypothetical protein VHU87_12880 [Rhizomicrobium sp.]|nr:hypothetical protein [Rhizomicrobium sp.]
MNKTCTTRLLAATIAALLPASAGIAHGGGYSQPIVIDNSGQAMLEQEMACRKGAPADPDDVAKAHTRIESVMQEFFALTPKSEPGDFEKLFDSNNPTWRDASGSVPLVQLAAHMPAAAPQRSLVLMVVGGDDQTARAIWSTSPADGGFYYAGDFVNHGWMGGWRMWHMTVSATKPDMPPAYCHFDLDRSY